MITPMPSNLSPRLTALVLALAPLLSIALTGCAKDSPRASYTAPMTPEDEAFLKGVNRPATTGTLFAMSRLLASQGRLGEAELMLRRCIEQAPHYLPAYNELAEMAMRRQRIGDAVEILHLALAIEPNNGGLRNNLGMCWLLRNEYETALDEFTRAAAAMPGDARPRANMAAALGLLGRLDEARAAYAQILPLEQAEHNVMILSQARDGAAKADAALHLTDPLDATLANSVHGPE